jgi:hypothetical protein
MRTLAAIGWAITFTLSWRGSPWCIPVGFFALIVTCLAIAIWSLDELADAEQNME